MDNYFSIGRAVESLSSAKPSEFEHWSIDKQREMYPQKALSLNHFLITREMKNVLVKNFNELSGSRSLTELTTTSGLSKVVSHRMLLEYIELLNTPITFQQVGINIYNIGERKQNAIIPNADTTMQADVINEGSEGAPVQPTFDEGFDIIPSIYKVGLNISGKFFRGYNDIQMRTFTDFIIYSMIENAIYRKLDRMIWYGSGISPEPRGLKNNANIQGFSGASFDRDLAIDMENGVELFNAQGPKYTIVHPNTKKLLKKRLLVSGSDKYLIQNNMMNDYPVISSSGFDEGDVWHGQFSTVLIMQFSDGIELFINPFKESGGVTISAWGYYCFTARHPKVISLATNVD